MDRIPTERRNEEINFVSLGFKKCICMAEADILHAYLLQVLAKGRVTYYHAEALVAKGSKY